MPAADHGVVRDNDAAFVLSYRLDGRRRFESGLAKVVDHSVVQRFPKTKDTATVGTDKTTRPINHATTHNSTAHSSTVNISTVNGGLR